MPRPKKQAAEEVAPKAEEVLETSAEVLEVQPVTQEAPEPKTIGNFAVVDEAGTVIRVYNTKDHGPDAAAKAQMFATKFAHKGYSVLK